MASHDETIIAISVLERRRVRLAARAREKRAKEDVTKKGIRS
jgi:hypothetical protein